MVSIKADKSQHDKEEELPEELSEVANSSFPAINLSGGLMVTEYLECPPAAMALCTWNDPYIIRYLNPGRRYCIWRNNHYRVRAAR
ncbi:hypothetical protein TNCV_4137601 [Trichonephila clavipes]|nr:hypothetical protein TNCV_4137601 [Trichonephila clavipes]